MSLNIDKLKLDTYLSEEKTKFEKIENEDCIEMKRALKWSINKLINRNHDYEYSNGYGVKSYFNRRTNVSFEDCHLTNDIKDFEQTVEKHGFTPNIFIQDLLYTSLIIDIKLKPKNNKETPTVDNPNKVDIQNK